LRELNEKKESALLWQFRQDKCNTTSSPRGNWRRNSGSELKRAVMPQGAFIIVILCSVATQRENSKVRGTNVNKPTARCKNYMRWP
jgi:hypothetical protein